MDKNKISEITMQFYTALADCYKEEENRELNVFSALKLEGGQSLKEDFASILLAFYLIYKDLTGDNDTDLLGFTHLLNRIAVMYCKNK